jgi:hypothetical protein
MAACSEDPTESGNLEPSAIVTDLSTTTRTVGTQFSITAYTIDKNNARIPGALTAASSAGLVVDSTVYFPELQETRVFVHATAIDSTSAAITITGGNLSKTVRVNAFPASLDIQIASEVGSGEAIPVVVNALSSTGASLGPVPFSVTSSATTVVFVSSAGEISARGTGTATLTFTGPGGATGTASVTVVPGSFTGTLSPTTGTGGTRITVTAPAGVTFDADTEVSIGNLITFNSNLTETTVEAVIPFGTPVGTAAVALSNVGPNQLALTTTVEVTALVENEASEPNDSEATAVPVTVPLDLVGSLSGTDLDDTYSFTFAAATAIDIFLEWDDDINGDLDLLVRWDGAFRCSFSTATGNIPEDGSCAIPAGKTVFFIVDNYDAATGGSQDMVNYHLVIKPAE